MSHPEFVIERKYDAPASAVWECWTKPDLVQRWYGPGVETTLHRFDPTPGGLWLTEMHVQDKSLYQRTEFTIVEAPARLDMLMSNADAEWNVIQSPMMPNWPRVLLTTVSLIPVGDCTKLELRWAPHEASEAEHEAFEAAMPSLQEGWDAGLTAIAEIIREDMEPG